MLNRLPTNLSALFISAITLSVLFLTPAPSFSAQATLAWDAATPSPQGYRIYQRTQSGSYNYNNPVWSGSGTTGTVANLNENTRYYFVVRSYTSTQVSGNSNEVSFLASANSGSTNTGGGGQQPYKGTPWSIPGTIEAENYDTGGANVAYRDVTTGNSGKAYRQDDVDVWSGGGTSGYFTGANANGEWLEYTANVTTAGSYRLDLKVATPNSGKRVRVLLDGADISGAISIPNTGSWGKWQTVTKTVNLSAGQHVVRVVFEVGGLNFDSIAFSSTGSTSTGSSGGTNTGSTSNSGSSGGSTNTGTTTGSGGGQQPYKGSPWSIPGTIEAENYDTGGANVAYRDVTTGNSGKAYRQDDVDVWSGGGTGGYFTGANSSGEWLEYTVNVKTAGTYSLDLNVATPNSGKRVRVLLDGADISGAISIPNTGAWGRWETVMKTVKLSAGQHVLRVVFEVGGLNFDSIEISPIGSTTASASSTGTGSTSSVGTTSGGQQPYTGTASAIPGTIEAEDYDTGGAGVAYRDVTTGNSGKTYRQDDVDIWGGGGAIGYFTGANANGEWLEYTVNVKTAGTYSLDLYVATPNSGRKMRVLADGTDITGAITIPSTGGWDKWDTVMKTVKLSAGKQVLRVVFEGGGVNFNWMDISPIGN